MIHEQILESKQSKGKKNYVWTFWGKCSEFL